MIRRVALTLAAAAPALVAGGCGTNEPDSSSKFRGEEKLVANAIEDLQSAGSKRDGDRICRELLAKPVVAAIRQAGSKSCAARIEKSLDDADTFELTVRSVKVEGGTARAVVASDAGDEKDRVDTIRLVKEGRRWKIASLDA